MPASTISNNKYLLPAIQREIVWNCEQIENLFDSILSGYPINSMLFWKYRIDFNHDNYKFYEFIKCYDKYNTENNHNKEHNVSGQNEIMAVLDGQQRLTALFIGLKGYMNLKKPRYRAGRAENYEKKFLYLNLLKNDRNTENEDLENKYEFKFKTIEDAEKDNSTQKKLWFKLENIIKYDSISKYKN